ncbi:MAG TPA: ATP-binding cassette domain-containing protein [Rhizobiales bacterium]|nr:ATP-binding cassette domain-containing protein [Hyphomicrobiales bacterium]
MAAVEISGDRSRVPSTGFKGRIDCRNIEFTYPDDPSPVLKGINLTIEPGEKVGVIGRIGCGKSTFIRLVPRFYEATSGAMLLDGHDIRQYSPQRLRRHVGYMPQDYSLFNDTLRENICLGMDDVSEPAFEKAVSIAGVKAFAARHPNGFGMQVGPGGERLSGGERQAVVLARTLLRDPAILILDEPTSAMDNTLERRLLENLRPEIEGRTLILATHRAPLLALVDRIIWLDGGRVIADGPRDEVLKSLEG